MSIDLILEVMDHAPADLTSGERMVLTVIAERANDKTRIAKQSTRWDLDVVARRAGVRRTGLKSIFQGLARKGCEVRIPVKVTPDGKPVFAFEGTAVTFKVPHFTERGGHSNPTERGGQGIPTDGAEGMPQHPRGEAVASERGGHSHPQSLKTLKEPSKFSLSDARTSVPAPREPDAEDRERDDSTSSEDPNHDLRHRLAIKHGCPEHLAEQVVQIIEAENPGIRGIGWWTTLDDKGHLAAHVRKALDLLASGGQAGCDYCGGSGKVTGHDQYDQPAPVDCPACTPMTEETRRAFVLQLAGQPTCSDGYEGGNIPMPGSGWMRCATCRLKSGYVPIEERNQQARTSEREPAEARKARGWLGLPVAERAQQQAIAASGHQAYRNPEDQAVYSDWSNR